ncbi:MAG: 23S rRNA (pseudouridine(1915)-N(3))-methyltransferase RlmH [Pseudomonadota bacterium]
MQITICAVGRLRRGPERDLVDDYLTRFERSGRGIGLGPVEVIEVDAKGGGQETEARLLTRALPGGAPCLALDERGRGVTSPDFADQIAAYRDAGHRGLAFVIGGADGLAPEVLQRADGAISFGAMVWPHLLARIMLTEQLYRAAQILTGTPYHRA